MMKEETTAVTLVTPPPVALNVPLDKDNPLPIVTVANLSVEDKPASLASYIGVIFK
jgi:hypothetical protein